MRQWFPFTAEQASTIAPRVDEFWWFLVGLTLFFVVLIAGLELAFAILYRRRSDDEVPLPVTGAVRLELLWIAIPLVISLAIFAWGASLFFSIARIPDEALDIYVTGKQWMWRVQHMEGRREINELHVPVGRKVRLTMTSEDVIHDFYVPAFRVKQDVLPGRYTRLWFEPTKPGSYRLFCAEYCGTDHSAMGGWVHVLEPAEFQAWLAGEPAGVSLASSGAELFEKLACHTCHRAGGEGRGPVLDDVFGNPVALADGSTVVADENYLRESILRPQARVVAGYGPPVNMPTYQGQVNEDQLLQLIEYIKSLGRAEASAGPSVASGVERAVTTP
jgi:cytochrome c oxidase subunit 2